MYLHLGDEVMAKNRQIIGVFDLDTSTVTKATRDFLAEANTGKGMPFPRWLRWYAAVVLPLLILYLFGTGIWTRFFR